MAQLPKFSIVTPSYNQAEFIEQTIDSVLSQNYPDLEYIIIDGGSTDGSVDIIKKYSSHLTYWISEPDNGQSHAINKGMIRVSGDVVNWLNSDDYYEPGALKIISAYFESPETNVVCARGNIVQNGKHLKVSSGTDIYVGNLAKTIGWARIDQPETFFRKRVYNSLGLVNDRYHFVMDKEFWVRYLLKYGLEGISRTGDVVVNFRYHDQSKTQSQRAKFDIETLELFYDFAMSSGHVLESETIGSIIDPSRLIRKESVFPSVPAELSKAVLQYFLLKKADEYYYANDLKTAKTLLASIDGSILAADDRTLLRKLNFRSAYVPEFIIRMLRR